MSLGSFRRRRRNGPTVGFVVGWPATGSVTTWAGRLQVDAEGTARLHTVWHLVRSVTGDPPSALDVWESVLTNCSVFAKFARYNLSGNSTISGS